MHADKQCILIMLSDAGRQIGNRRNSGPDHNSSLQTISFDFCDQCLIHGFAATVKSCIPGEKNHHPAWIPVILLLRKLLQIRQNLLYHIIRLFLDPGFVWLNHTLCTKQNIRMFNCFLYFSGKALWIPHTDSCQRNFKTDFLADRFSAEVFKLRHHFFKGISLFLCHRSNHINRDIDTFCCL